MKFFYTWIVLTGTMVFVSGMCPEISLADQTKSDQPSPQIVVNSMGDPAASIPPPEPSGEITLDMALYAAINRHPSLAATWYEIHARKGATLQAGMLPNPVLFGEAEEFGGSRDYSGTDVMSSRIGISQEFLLGGKIGKRVKEAEAAVKIANLEHRAKFVEISAQVEHRFLEVHTLQERSRIHAEQLDIIDKTHNVVSKRVKSGDVSPLDLARSQVELAAYRIEIERTRKALEIARYTLAESWGSTSPLFSAVSAQYAYNPELSEPELKKALEKSAAWQLLEAQSVQAETAHELAKANGIPDIELGGGYQHFNETNDHAFFLELSIPIPVFDRNKGGIAEAAALKQKASLDRHAGFLALRTELQTAWRNVIATRQSVLSLEQEVYPAAKQSYESIRKAYQAGALDIISLLDAQRTWVETRTVRLELLYELEAGIIEIRRLIGARAVTPAERKSE